MKEIFGGNQEVKKETEKRKSVYDLEPDGDDFAAGPTFTPAKPSPASTPAKAQKKEGVTKIGNNTYFYTGPRSRRKQAEQEEEEMENEENQDQEMMPLSMDDNDGEAFLIKRDSQEVTASTVRYLEN